jgi:Ctr copper transporter family
VQRNASRQPFRWKIEVQRMLLGFIMAVLGYAMMLVAMTYIVVHLLSKLYRNLRDIFWRFVQVWRLENLYLVDSILKRIHAASIVTETHSLIE